MNTPKEEETDWLNILDTLDQWGVSDGQLPACPACESDTLAVIHKDLIICYACDWRYERT